MPKIDAVISNDRHHPAMVLPVLERLGGSGHPTRVLSLCELRGMSSPETAIHRVGAELLRLFPAGVRRSPSLGRSRSGTRRAWRRAVARSLLWHTSIDGRLRRALREPPDVVILPNDAAFPYDRIARTLHRADVPFVLLQEGIRFVLPADEPGEGYGTGGADAVAAWGPSSVEFFRRQGVPAERIHVTGSPRFDIVAEEDWSRIGRQLAAHYDFSERVVLLVTNPIDDQGFCTADEKKALIRTFLKGIDSWLGRTGVTLAIKLHARESEAEYRTLVAPMAHASRVRIIGHESLYGLFHAADAVLILASTVGLEALLFDMPLGVIHLPNVGFVNDFVSRGAALGIHLANDLGEQLEDLFDRTTTGLVSEYRDANLGVRTGSTALVADLTLRIARADGR